MPDAARAVSGFVTGRTLADYVQDRMLRGAVEQHVEIIDCWGVCDEDDSCNADALQDCDPRCGTLCSDW